MRSVAAKACMDVKRTTRENEGEWRGRVDDKLENKACTTTTSPDQLVGVIGPLSVSHKNPQVSLHTFHRYCYIAAIYHPLSHSSMLPFFLSLLLRLSEPSLL